MAGFFKRFKTGNQEPPIADKKIKDEEKKDKSSMNPPNMDLSDNEGLSLFSGMTFSSDSSPQTKEQTHQTEQAKSSSTELAEAGLDFHFNKPSIESSKSNVDSPQPEDKDIDFINIHEEIQLNSNTRNIGGSGIQPGKKKKKTQAKQPGYARDSKPASSDDKKGSVISKSTNQETCEASKNQDCASQETETKQEPSFHSVEQIPECGKSIKIADRTNTNEATAEDNLQVKSDGDDACVVSDDGDSCRKEIETNRSDFHQLYSIGTPTSSEENLSVDDIVVQQEEDTKSTEAIDESKNNQKSLESQLEIDKENCESRVDESEDESFQNDDESNLELQTTSKSSIEEKEESDIHEEGKSLERDSKAIGNNDKVRHNEKTYDISVDAEDKLTIMEQDIQFRISNLKEDEVCLANLTTYLVENYSNVETAYLDKQNELENLIKEESNAIAEDNYDLAEELAVKIQQAEEDLEKTKYKAPVCDIKVQETLKLSSELAARTLSIHREAEISLEEFREEQVAVLDHHNEENASKISKEKQHLNLEKQRIERTRAHLTLDNEHLKKEDDALEDEINERTEKFVAHKKELMEEHQQIKQGILDLEERLKQLRLKESQYRDDINAEEIKIEEILEEFLPQRNALDLQRKDLENQQKLLDEQQEALASSQEAYNNVIEEWNRRKIRLSEFLDRLQSAIESNNSLIGYLEKRRGELEDFQCLKHLSSNADPSLDKLKSSAKRSHQQIKTLHTKIHLSNRTATSLRKSLSEIEAQISDRNEAKDIAKKERNFKEAKRLKEESEALNTEGIKNQKKLESVLQDLNNDNELLKNAEKDFKNISENLKEEEFKSAIQLVNSASQVLQELERNVERYSSNDLLFTLLTAEITTCKNLIKELCLKHEINVPTSDCQENDQDTNEPSTHDVNTTSQNFTSVDKESLQRLLDDLEVKLEVVVELEDFDEAERIQQEIDEMKARLQ